MKSKNNIQELITYIPYIKRLRNFKYSYPQILSILKSEHNFDIFAANPTSYLTAALSNIANGKVNSKFNDYQILNIPDREINDYSEFCVQYENSFYFTRKEIKVPKSYLVNEMNIHQITSAKGCIVAKRILKIYDTPDSAIIEKFNEYWSYINLNVSNDDKIFIHNIHHNIITIFNDLVSRLMMKPYFYKDIFNEKE